MEIIEEFTDFYLIGQDDDDGKLDFTSAKPQDVRVGYQTLYQSIDEDFGTGDPVGVAHWAVIVGREGFAICHAILVIEKDHTIVAHGVLPQSGEGVTDGVLAVTGGTGDFNGVGGRIDLTVVNPKKYHIVTTSTGG